MLPAGAALLTLMLAPLPAAGGERVALASPLLAPVSGAAAGAMATPPETVVRRAPRYGDVTVDHAKHLRLQAKCVRCHGPGPAGKLVLGPRLGHERCVGCHKESRAGPTSCSGCHVKPAARSAPADLPPLVRPEPPPPQPEAAPPPAPLLIRAPLRLLRDPATREAAGVVVVVEEPSAEAPRAEADAQALAREKFLAGRDALEIPETFVGEAAAPERAAPGDAETDGSRLKRLVEGREVMEVPEVVVAASGTAAPAPSPGADVTRTEAPAPGASAADGPARGPAAGPPPGATLALGTSAGPGPAPAIVAAGSLPLDDGATGRRGARQLLQLGFAAGTGIGPSLRITSRAERIETAYVLERLRSADGARILMAYDAGASWPLQHRFTAWAVGTAGFDAQERPAIGFSPILGARGGLEWAPPRGWLVRSLHLSLTALYAVAPSGGIGDQRAGFRVFATLATGLPVPGLARAR